MGAPELGATPRPTCYDCFRPASLCYCDTLRPVDNRTRVVVVQHPRESFHPLNTARIAEGCLQRVQVVRARPSEVDAELSTLDLPPDAALLFPAADAQDIDELTADQRPSCVVVLDGTWHHARTLKRDCPRLAALPRIRFTPPAPSEYRIRREPQSDYLSTIESIAHVLERLEPETSGIERLRESFRTLVDRAIAARVRAPSAGRSKRPRPRGERTPPLALGTPIERVVVVYAEAAADLEGKGNYPLLVVARRQGAPLGAPRASVQRLLLRTPAPPHPRLLEHLAIDPDELPAAAPLDAARDSWRSLVGPEDLVVSWSLGSLTVLRAAGFAVPQSSYLKEVYCNGQARRGVTVRGGLDELVRLHGASTPYADLSHPRGRAIERLRQTEAMLHWMRSENDREPDTF